MTFLSIPTRRLDDTKATLPSGCDNGAAVTFLRVLCPEDLQRKGCDISDLLPEITLASASVGTRVWGEDQTEPQASVKP